MGITEYMLPLCAFLILGCSKNESLNEIPDKMSPEGRTKPVLSDIQYEVTQKGGTEPAFSGEYWDAKADGHYECVCCSNPLFSSESKYESGTGWPSYWQPIDDSAVTLHSDRKLFRERTEVRCGECDAHLGHVFDDGPQPTGKRYCMNSAALTLVERDK
jgi:peptide-methionine (R)-S-oxide reductase